VFCAGHTSGIRNATVSISTEAELMSAADIANLVVKPAVTGTMRARKTKAERDRVTKRQWAAYIGVAVVTTLLTRQLNQLIERRLGD
jgi:hypothetical protein